MLDARLAKVVTMMFPLYGHWNNQELYEAIDALMAQTEQDEDLQPGLDARLADIYDAPDDPGLRDYLGAVDAAISAHLGLVAVIAERGAVLDALLEEYERVREANAQVD